MAAFVLQWQSWVIVVNWMAHKAQHIYSLAHHRKYLCILVLLTTLTLSLETLIPKFNHSPSFSIFILKSTLTELS